MAMTVKYKGGGEYHGIPAADMTDAEYEALSPEQKATVAGSPYYTVRYDAPKLTDPTAPRDMPKADALKAEDKK